MVSLVILLRRPIEPDLSQVADRMDSLFPGHFVREGGGENDSFVLPGPTEVQIVVKSLAPDHSGFFCMNFGFAPYTLASGFEQRITDTDLYERVRQHTGWLSVDRWLTYGSDDDAYRFIGKTLASLAPVDALAVVRPETEATVPFGLSTHAALMADNVLEALRL